MASTHIRIEKIMKELNDLFQKRLDNFEDLKFYALNSGDKERINFCYGKASAYRRSIFTMLNAFSLTDTDLFLENDKRFELDYLTEWEEELSKLNE